MQFSRIIERLAKIPRAQRLMIYGAIYMILVVGYFFGLYLPSSGSLGDLQTEQKSLLDQQAQVNARVENRAQFEAELQQMRHDLNQALKELPNDREIPGLLKSISTLGKKVGLEVRRFQPMPEVPREYVAEVPVGLEVEGTYHEVAMFFDRLSKMNRIVYVQDIEMGNPEERGGNVNLRVEGNAVTFRFLTDDEKKTTDDSKSKGKGRRRAKAQ